VGDTRCGPVGSAAADL